jgi:hypothetical protein
MRSWINRVTCTALVLGIVVGMPKPLPAQLSFPTTGQPVEVIKFRLPDYNSDGTLKSEMFGDRAVIEGNLIVITTLRVEMYEQGQLVTSFWAESCRYDKAKGELETDSPVRVTRAGLVITGDGMDWKKGEPQVTLRRNVRVVAAGGAAWFKREKKK